MSDGTEVERPECCTDEMMDFLDNLRDSGKTNMMLAPTYLWKKFSSLGMEDCQAVFNYWIYAGSHTKNK